MTFIRVIAACSHRFVCTWLHARQYVDNHGTCHSKVHTSSVSNLLRPEGSGTVFQLLDNEVSNIREKLARSHHQTLIFFGLLFFLVVVSFGVLSEPPRAEAYCELHENLCPISACLLLQPPIGPAINLFTLKIYEAEILYPLLDAPPPVLIPAKV